MSEDKIPVLTDIVGVAKNREEFNFDGLVPGKALTEADIKQLQRQIDRVIKHRITQSYESLYKDLHKDIHQVLKNINHDNK